MSFQTDKGDHEAEAVDTDRREQESKNVVKNICRYEVELERAATLTML